MLPWGKTAATPKCLGRILLDAVCEVVLYLHPFRPKEATTSPATAAAAAAVALNRGLLLSSLAVTTVVGFVFVGCCLCWLLSFGCCCLCWLLSFLLAIALCIGHCSWCWPLSLLLAFVVLLAVITGLGCCFWPFVSTTELHSGESLQFLLEKIPILADGTQNPQMTGCFPPKRSQQCYMTSCKC